MPYWFFRWFNEVPDVEVVDISSFPLLEKFEKNVSRFYIWQTLKVLFKINRYDLVISHGMQSGVVLSLWRRFFKTRCKHIVFDIGSFNSAAERGFALRLMQFASRSIDGLIYHASSQLNYYDKCFPWLCPKSRFIRFGTDLDFFRNDDSQENNLPGNYILCVGSAKRDWKTLVDAWQKIDTDIKLKLIGHIDEGYMHIKGVEQIGFVSVKELITQIRNALFCVLPLESYNYSYGQMTLMQQMALNKCVITAKVPGIADYVKNEQTVLLYESGDANDLKEKMEKVLSDADLRNSIASAARKYLEQHCNERVMAVEIQKFINAVMQSNSLSR